MIKMDKDVESQIRMEAESINCTPEQYLNVVIDQYFRDENKKDVFINKRKEYQEFAKSFWKVNDEVKEITQKKNIHYINDMEMDPAMVKVIEEMDYLISHSSSLLLYLYSFYETPSAIEKQSSKDYLAERQLEKENPSIDK